MSEESPGMKPFVEVRNVNEDDEDDNQELEQYQMRRTWEKR